MKSTWFRNPLVFGGVFGIIHGTVDLVTVSVAFAVSRIFGISFVWSISIIVLYDVIAFAGQALIGVIADRTRTYRGLTLAGIGATALSVPLLSISPVAAAVCTAIGNAAFHVGAGALSLRAESGRATVPGIFVAPGALGLGIATMLGKSGLFYPWPFIALMAVVFAVVLRFPLPSTASLSRAEIPTLRLVPLITFLLLASISIRALVGFGGAYQCSRTAGLKIALMMAAFLGKGLGGVISDKIGWIRCSVGALLISMPLIAFLGDMPVTLVAGFVLFQMTMPVTLVAVERMMPRRPGLAFGLCSLALVAGSLVAFSKTIQAAYNPWVFAGLITVSAIMVYVSLEHLARGIPMKR